jgi:two-component system response regulator AtoC
MSPPLQAKLLRVLQEREFERVGGLKRLKLRARVIAATHQDLESMVAANRFREDLYQRLKVVTVSLPPLRDRAADVPDLVWHLLAKINLKVHKQVNRIPPEVLDRLIRLPWPGNVREMENVLTRAVVLAPGDVLLAEHLPELPAVGPSAQQAPGPAAITTLAEAEKDLIRRVLVQTGGHRGKSCELLGISRPTLERKLRKYGLKASIDA